jgi:hypothetical protein
VVAAILLATGAVAGFLLRGNDQSERSLAAFNPLAKRLGKRTWTADEF